MDRLLHPVCFSDKITVPGNIFLAPMAGFTDAAFRDMVSEWGAAMGYTEMVSSEALTRNSEKTEGLMRKGDLERFYAIQIFASNADVAVRSLPKVAAMKPNLIDINCGCPVPKVLKSGCGAALGRDPERIYEIVKALKNETDIPVSIKFRSGWDKSSINFLQVAEAAQRAGVNAMTLHPRTRSQDYAGFADWSLIKELKKNSSVPVIGSGDLFSPEAVRDMLTETGCDAVMIARGSVGCPEIFTYSRELIEKGSYTPISPQTRLENALKHFNSSVKYLGANMACKEMKKHLCAYTKGLPGSAEIRNRIVYCTTAEEYLEILTDFLK